MQDIAEDRMSANPQEDIPATPEGEIITLNLYFTKNGPSNNRGLLLNIETSGTATGVCVCVCVCLGVPQLLSHTNYYHPIFFHGPSTQWERTILSPDHPTCLFKLALYLSM